MSGKTSCGQLLSGSAASHLTSRLFDKEVGCPGCFRRKHPDRVGDATVAAAEAADTRSADPVLVLFFDAHVDPYVASPNEME